MESIRIEKEKKEKEEKEKIDEIRKKQEELDRYLLFLINWIINFFIL